MSTADLSAAIQAAMNAEGCQMREGHSGIPTPDIWLECVTHDVASQDGATCSLVARIVTAAYPVIRSRTLSDAIQVARWLADVAAHTAQTPKNLAEAIRGLAEDGNDR